jgi:hypothetical protein
VRDPAPWLVAAGVGPSTGTNAEFAFEADFSIGIRISLLEESFIAGKRGEYLIPASQNAY